MNDGEILRGQLVNVVDKDVAIIDVIYKYLKYWKWICLSFIVFMSLGYIYIQKQVPEYKVEADLLIKDNKDGGMSGEKDLLKQLDLNSSDKIIDNEIQILKSNALMEKVVSKLHLQTSYAVIGHITTKILYKNLPFEVTLLKARSAVNEKSLKVRLLNNNRAEIDGKSFPVNAPVNTEFGTVIVTPRKVEGTAYLGLVNVIFDSIENVAQSYINKLNIDPASKQATVLFITIQDADPDRGKDILNELIDEYNKAAIEDKDQTTSNQLSFIETRLNAIANELSVVEKNVENYKSSNNIADISAQSQIFLQGVQNNDADLNKLKLQKGSLKNLEDYLMKPYDVKQHKLPSMLGIEDPSLLSLTSQLGELQIKRESLLQTISEKNPIIISIDDQISALRQSLLLTLQNVKTGLAINEKQLEQQAQSYNSSLKKIPSKERGLIDVMREQDIKSNLFTYLLQKREETALALASSVSDSRIINKAKSSNIPIKPVKKLIYIFFFIVSIVVPLAIIYLSNILNYKVGNRSDIEKATLIPIISEISYLPHDNTSLLVLDKPRSIVAEQIRGLRTNLQFLLSENGSKVILFTSISSGEGKSFISLNLGGSLAMTGKKVIIFDLDLRRPQLHVPLGYKNDDGLSNYLIGKSEYSEIVQQVPGLPNFQIITCGPVPPNPAELLGNGRLEDLIKELRGQFDYILLDAPPIGLVTDAQIISQWADITMFMVRHNYTRKSQIDDIDSFYRRKILKNINIIFNSIPTNSGGYGYNGYGYGYYEESKPKRKGLFD